MTPSARSANLIAGDGTKNGLPAPNKELRAKPNNDRLTGKAPYKSTNFRFLFAPGGRFPTEPRKTAVPETRVSDASSQVARKEASGTNANPLFVRGVMRHMTHYRGLAPANPVPAFLFIQASPSVEFHLFLLAFGQTVVLLSWVALSAATKFAMKETRLILRIFGNSLSPMREVVAQLSSGVM